LLGRRMLREKSETNRSGTLFWRIDMKTSFLRISSRRESTHRFIAVCPSRIPIPYGSARNVSAIRCAERSAAATPTS